MSELEIGHPRVLSANPLDHLPEMNESGLILPKMHL
jgi:hypothetical protein